MSVYPHLFDLLPKIAPRRWVVIPSYLQSRTNKIFHINAHLFQLHAQLKWNRLQTVITNFNATVVIN